MPVRSLSSSVLKWPDNETVDKAVRIWAEEVARRRKDVLQIGYFGSYARGDWGFGSDLDLVVVLEEPVDERGELDATDLPVPADLLVYAEQELQSLKDGRFFQTLMQEAVWVYQRDRDLI
jgi:predicted nucleotidyltransferase